MKKTNSKPPPKAAARLAAAMQAKANTAITTERASSEPPFQQPLRLISKVELLKRVPVTFPTIWKMMREEPPLFPRSRNIGGKAAWVEAEVEEWISTRPVSQFKPPLDKSAQTA